MAAIGKLTQLRRLQLLSGVDDDLDAPIPLDQLAPLENLRVLELPDCSGVSEAQWKMFIKAHSNLEALAVERMGPNDEDVARYALFSALPYLQVLATGHEAMDPSVLQGFPGLNKLFFQGFGRMPPYSGDFVREMDRQGVTVIDGWMNRVMADDPRFAQLFLPKDAPL